ncbi:MAG: hypothetical protein LBG73_11375 [Spirochaetaceae bacterium]|jgi:hypothetical protein|nr:hypothetical protein [Spirochaetaceae bacterium]
MAELASGFILAEDEKLVMEIEAELWATSSNPIARILGEIRKVIAMILGFRRKGFLIITDKRVIEVSTLISFWCITTIRQVKYVPPNAVNEIGYLRLPACGCFCPAYHLYYRTTSLFGQHNDILLKGADEPEALKAANAFYTAIANAMT